MKTQLDNDDAYIVEGKLALPYAYLAGSVGSKFITTLRDQHKILGVRCDQCKLVFVPPRQTCEKCLQKTDENWVELENSGEVTNFTIVRYQDKHLPRTSPYILAEIKLGGADTSLVHVVEGIDLDKIEIGTRVKAVFSDETTNTIMDIDHFEPA